MSVRAAFDTALEAARQWHAALPACRDFISWPTDLRWHERAAHMVPASRLVQSDPGVTSAASSPLLQALQGITDHVEWRLTYTEEEVGKTFLQTFGWFELAGPDGHFLTDQTRITVGYWGPGLFYPRHQHEPEELYTVVSGSAEFHADGDRDITLGAGGTRLHGANQPHAMTTKETPVLTLVFWRGAGLADPPRMTQ